MSFPKTAAILLAAGNSRRMNAFTNDKVLHEIEGTAILTYSLNTFEEVNFISDYIVVYRDAHQQKKLETAIPPHIKQTKPIHWIQGGATRQGSVYNALNALSNAVEIVFIHDAARPLITTNSLQALFSSTLRYDAAVLAHRIADSIKRVQATDPLSTATDLEPLNRSQLWAMETPQAFKRSIIQKAYDFCIKKNIHATDDTATLSALGLKVKLIENTSPNPKLTTPKDLDYISFLLKKR